MTFADKQTLYVVFLAGTFLCTFAERQTLCCFPCRNICRQANTCCFSYRNIADRQTLYVFFLQEHLQTGKHCMLYFLQEHFFDICRQANTVCCFSCRNISLHICREANPMLFSLQEHFACCFSYRNIADRQTLYVFFLAGTFADRQTLDVVYLA